MPPSTPARAAGLTVAVTGPTGTFGSALVPLLQDDEQVGTVVGVARSPFDPAARGWTKMTYRQGDVRKPEDLRAAFAGADVVVHLAFLILGGAPETTHAINVEGTLNAFREAAAAGASRFVYASSIAAYGFHDDNPVGMSEDWPTRPADRLFYAQQKAELEQLLEAEAERHPEMELYVLRPPIVLGPDTLGGKVSVPPQVLAALSALRSAVRRVPVPLLVPNLPLQLIHQDDVARALLLCIRGEGPAGSYNIAADDLLTVADFFREVGLVPLPVPAGPVGAAVRAALRVPGLPTFVHWLEAISHPAVMDTTRAKEDLGWRPRHSALDSLRSALGDLP